MFIQSLTPMNDSIGSSYPGPKDHKGARATIAAGEHLSRYTKRPEKKGLEGGVPSDPEGCCERSRGSVGKADHRIRRSYRSASRLQPEVEVVS